MIDLLRRNFQCIAYELPDGGWDCARLGRYRHSDVVDDLLALFQRLKLPRAYLFGSSFGTTIALAAMLVRPASIPRCVLQGGFAHRPVIGWERLACLWLRYGHGLMGTIPLRRFLHPNAEYAVFKSNKQPELWEFLLANSSDVSKSAAARRGLMLEHVDLRARLPEIRQPVLLISGENDSIVCKDCDRTLMERLPHVDRVEIPTCGHYPQYTHAALVAELTRQFLSAPDCMTSAK
jgi:pimeloyl-ACP methyl ester carboxylesterase